jgi:DNA gyrase/topoisomerase IV subunit B
MKTDSNYDASSITELKYPDNCRQKIGMYLGDASINGFNHTFTEILDNSIDEFVAGYGDTILIDVDTSIGKVSIRDFGRGIPYGINKDGVSALTLALTTLHAGGKHRSKKGEETSYKYSSGVHGVGASVVTAISDSLDVVVFKDGFIAKQSFENGIKTTEVVISEQDKNTKELNGTYISFIPSVKKDDFDENGVFEYGCKFEFEWIDSKLKYLPYLNNGLEIKLTIDGKERIYKRKDKLSDILDVNVLKDTLHVEHVNEENETALAIWNNGRKKVVDLSQLKNETGFKDFKTTKQRFAFNFAQGRDLTQLFFVNGVKVKGGKQETQLKSQLKKQINEYLKEFQPKIFPVETEDILSNMTFIYSVQIQDPMFSGQTKEALNNPEISPLATDFFKSLFSEWLETMKQDELKLLMKILEASKRARMSSEKVQEEIFSDFFSDNDEESIKEEGKLKKCLSKDNSKTELMIIEGDSAGGSVGMSRSVKYQAYIPLKGKPLNTIKEGNRLKILKNKEIRSLIHAIGTGIGPKYDYEKRKYDKIIILADADVDGRHIQALLMVFFYTYFKDLIDKGHLYVAIPPLYKITKGKNETYMWTKEEMDIYMKDNNNPGNIVRYKGLGEMEPSEIFDTTLHPVNRRLIKIGVDEAETAIKELEIFMGDSDKNAKLELKNIIRDYYIDNVLEKQILSLDIPENEKGDK